MRASGRGARRATHVLVAVGAVALGAVVPLNFASAAVIDDAITNIEVTPTNPSTYDTIRTALEWCVPDGTAEGDTFTVGMPEQLIDFPLGFPLLDPLGEVVANAVVVGDPAVATFTMTAYAETRLGVCGDAFVESNLDSDEYQGTTQVLDYSVNGVVKFSPEIDVQDTSGFIDRDSSRKEGGFRQGNDQCRTDATDCLAWWIEGVPGPLETFAVEDFAAAGLTFNCASLRMQFWSLTDLGRLETRFIPEAVGATTTMTCSPTEFTISSGPVPDGLLPRVEVYATPDVTDPAGGVEFVNTAIVTLTDLNGEEIVDTVDASRVSSTGGGTGDGSTTTTTTTTLPVPTTSEVPEPIDTPPATVPAPNTTTPIPTDILPETGSDNSLSVYAFALLAFGVALTMLARRRPA